MAGVGALPFLTSLRWYLPSFCPLLLPVGPAFPCYTAVHPDSEREQPQEEVQDRGSGQQHCYRGPDHSRLAGGGPGGYGGSCAVHQRRSEGNLSATREVYGDSLGQQQCLSSNGISA